MHKLRVGYLFNDCTSDHHSSIAPSKYFEYIYALWRLSQTDTYLETYTLLVFNGKLSDAFLVQYIDALSLS